MDPLAQLQDIHIPEEVAIWPLAYGWWLLIACIAVLMITAISLCIGAYRRRSTKRRALKTLAQLEGQTQVTVADVNGLLKQACIAEFGQVEVAPLYGEQWHDFLLEQLPLSKRSDIETELHVMVQAMYRSGHGISVEQALTTAKTWISLALPSANKSRKKRNIQGAQLGVNNV